MENQNNSSQTNNRKAPTKALVLFGAIGVIILVAVGFFIFNKNKASNDPQFIDDKEKEQIERQSIPGSTKFEKDGLSFSFPSDYKVEEREKGYYVVFKNENKTLGEAGISIDARRNEVNKNYEQAIKAGRNSLNEQVEKEIPGGIKMFGKIREGLGKGIPTLYVFLKYGDGAIKVEHSGEILNEAVFDQVINSIKIK